MSLLPNSCGIAVLFPVRIAQATAKQAEARQAKRDTSEKEKGDWEAATAQAPQAQQGAPYQQERQGEGRGE